VYDRLTKPSCLVVSLNQYGIRVSWDTCPPTLRTALKMNALAEGSLKDLFVAEYLRVAWNIQLDALLTSPRYII